MPRWEYRAIAWEDDLSALNAAGAEGWEAVGVQGPGVGAFVLLKRRVTNNGLEPLQSVTQDKEGEHHGLA